MTSARKNLRKIVAYDSFQANIPIAFVSQGIVVLRDGGMACVIGSGGVNLELMGAEERAERSAAFFRLIHGLDHPLYIFVRDEVPDLSWYDEALADLQREARSERMFRLVTSHRARLQRMQVAQTAREKRVYWVVPDDADAVALGTLGIPGSSLFSRGKRSSGHRWHDEMRDLRERGRRLLRALDALTLSPPPRFLTSEELVHWLYRSYDPLRSARRPLGQAVEMVQPYVRGRRP